MGIGFRLNSSYTNWSNGVDLVLKISNQSIQIVNTFYTFLYTNENKYNENSLILNQFKNSMYQYVALSFDPQYSNTIDSRRMTMDIFYVEDNKHYLKKSKSSDVGFDSPIDCLEKTLPSQRRFLLYESNIKKTLIQNTHARFIDTSQLNILLQSIDVLCNYRYTLFRMRYIPPVCIYIQLLDFYMYTYLIVYIISIIPQTGLYSCIWASTWGFIISLAINVSKEIDTPFGNDKNDIQLNVILQNTKRDIDGIALLLK